jgi:enoyl-CoA hydratase/3-hydroxyacyl-CoA dehydrogenase
MFVFKAAVVGAGTMGGQIAQTIAAAQIPVVLKDVDREAVDAGIAEARRVTESRVAKQVEKGRLTAAEGAKQVDELLGLIFGTTDYKEFGQVDFVIEAVTEDIDVKQTVFEELDAVTPGHAILASNTSSLSVTEIGDFTLRTEKVVGFHFFFPASVMPLVEVVEGDDTSAETMSTAIAFAMAIRKSPIRCADVPGFAVNRIITSGLSEIHARQEAGQLAIDKIDAGLVERKAVPMGPYELDNLLGLDTVLHVSQQMQAVHGDRFYVPNDMTKLVKEGNLGTKTGSGYFDTKGKPMVEGQVDPDIDELVELLQLKTLLEAVFCLEDGVATHRDIDFAMIAGAGMDPRKGLTPPFMLADQEGLDKVLKRLEKATQEFGARFEPPTVLRRLVAQGRLGQKSGQGFYAYPKADKTQPGETVRLETRGDVAIAWLANGQMNSISSQVVRDLAAIFAVVQEQGSRALIIASANPFVFSAGADVKEFKSATDTAIAREMNKLTRAMETSNVVTIAAVNGLAFGGGCELAMACDVRLAARSALFGQPEIKLGIMPGFGGTQRLPRLIGTNRALELNLTGDPIGAEEAFEVGLVNRVHVDHELFDAALAWARRASDQAPLAVGQIKRVSGAADLDEGLRQEEQAFGEVFGSADGKEGIAAFLGRRRPKWTGK